LNDIKDLPFDTPNIKQDKKIHRIAIKILIAGCLFVALVGAAVLVSAASRYFGNIMAQCQRSLAQQ
jgi:hypothetical protein